MEQNKSKILIVLLTVCIVLNLMQYNKVKSLEQAVYNITSQMNSQLNNMNYTLDSRISNGYNMLDSQLAKMAQSARNSYDERFEVTAYHPGAKTASVDISFSLREYEPEAEISVSMYSSGGHAARSAVESLGGGRFFAELEIPVNGAHNVSYEISGDKTVSGELMSIDVSEVLLSRFVTECTYSSSYSNGNSEYTIFPYVLNAHDGKDALKIEKVALEIASGGEMLYSWDLLPYIEDYGDNEALRVNLSEKEQVAVAAGDMTLAPEMPGEDDTDSFNGFSFTPSEDLTIKFVMEDRLGVRYSWISDGWYFSQGAPTPASNMNGTSSTQSMEKLVIEE